LLVDTNGFGLQFLLTNIKTNFVLMKIKFREMLTSAARGKRWSFHATKAILVTLAEKP
jgi:hypothetical protein